MSPTLFTPATTTTPAGGYFLFDTSAMANSAGGGGSVSGDRDRLDGEPASGLCASASMPVLATEENTDLKTLIEVSFVKQEKNARASSSNFRLNLSLPLPPRWTPHFISRGWGAARVGSHPCQSRPPQLRRHWRRKRGAARGRLEVGEAGAVEGEDRNGVWLRIIIATSSPKAPGERNALQRSLAGN